MRLIFWIVLVAVILLLLRMKSKNNLNDLVCPECDEEEPNLINVFPNYPKKLPLEVKLGDKLNFLVKGYNDKCCIKEVMLDEHDIEWQHQNYIGNFVGAESDIIKGRINISYQVPSDEKYIGKLVYITARYHGLQDTTWLKIIN